MTASFKHIYETAIFWDIAPCSPAQLIPSLKMEVIRFSETPVYI
jgi:hypothetical protein